jgi:hypothetical protein
MGRRESKPSMVGYNACVKYRRLWDILRVVKSMVDSPLSWIVKSELAMGDGAAQQSQQHRGFTVHFAISGMEVCRSTRDGRGCG